MYRGERKYTDAQYIVRLICFLGIIATFCVIPDNHSAYAASLDTPQIEVRSYCLNATVSWKKVNGATGYELWYMPYGQTDAWESVDLDADTEEITGDLWDGAHFYVALIAYNNEEWSEFSQTRILKTGNFVLPPNPNIYVNGMNVTLSWNSVDHADGYRLWYSLDSWNTKDKIDFDRNSTQISVDLWEGAYLNVVMQSSQKDGKTSDYSGVIRFFTGEKPDLPASPPVSTPFYSDVVKVFPSNPFYRYNNILQDCVYSDKRKDSCSLSVLPLLGQEYSDLTVDNIIDRTVVSHQWMAERFRTFLTMLPAQALNLFRAVTAIVISSDIRPAHYNTETGAIYIDPDYLWITQQEKDTVDQTPDYRSECGDSLKYIRLFRYTKDGRYVYNYNNRTDTDILNLMGRLLFHELSHANDYFPPGSVNQISRNISVMEASGINLKNRLSYRLQQNFPLFSDILKYQAQVEYGCRSATCTQTAYTPDEIAIEFMDEMANDTYNYVDTAEDLAMIAEEVMMLYFLGAERDVAITDVPKTENPTSKDYIVRWGQRRRIADPMIRNKAEFIMSGLLPAIDFSSFFNQLQHPDNMIKGRSWSDNLATKRRMTRESSSDAGLAEQERNPEKFINYR